MCQPREAAGIQPPTGSIADLARCALAGDRRHPRHTSPTPHHTSQLLHPPHFWQPLLVTLVCRTQLQVRGEEAPTAPHTEQSSRTLHADVRLPNPPGRTGSGQELVGGSSSLAAALAAARHRLLHRVCGARAGGSGGRG